MDDIHGRDLPRRARSGERHLSIFPRYVFAFLPPAFRPPRGSLSPPPSPSVYYVVLLPSIRLLIYLLNLFSISFRLISSHLIPFRLLLRTQVPDASKPPAHSSRSSQLDLNSSAAVVVAVVGATIETTPPPPPSHAHIAPNTRTTCNFSGSGICWIKLLRRSTLSR